MRILLFLLLLSPSLIYAGCGDCDEVHAEIERETEMDANYHDCRNCKAVMTDMEDTSNCPAFGSVCENKFYTNTLSASGNCQCLEAKCGHNAKLMVKIKIEGEQDPFVTSRMRCNNSEWMVDGVVVETATCAKNCDLGGCKGKADKYSPDFSELFIVKADETPKSCATATCKNGLATLKPDGTLDQDIGNLLPPVETVTCSGDGTWTWKEGSDTKESKRVMCIASACGPLKCPAAVTGADVGKYDLVPLVVTRGVGEQCATAACPAGFMEITEENGLEFDGPIQTDPVTCNPDGTWGTYDYGVMCKQPACKFSCNPTPFTYFGGPLQPPIREDCTYKCPHDQMLMRFDATYGAPIAIQRATCGSDEKYLADSTYSLDQIGCSGCDVTDGQYVDPRIIPTTVMLRPISDACVLSCEKGYSLHYGPGFTDMTLANNLYRTVKLPLSETYIWYDSERSRTVGQTDYIACLKI